MLYFVPFDILQDQAPFNRLHTHPVMEHVHRKLTNLTDKNASQVVRMKLKIEILLFKESIKSPLLKECMAVLRIFPSKALSMQTVSEHGMPCAESNH